MLSEQRLKYSFSNSFPIQVITEYGAEFPMLYSTGGYYSK